MSVDYIDEVKQRLEQDRIRTAKRNAGVQILFNFYRRHPELTVCDANDKIIENFLGMTEFTLQTLENGLASFGPSMARNAPKVPEMTAHIPPVQEPEPQAELVPYTRRQLLQLDRETFRTLYNQGQTTRTEIDRILNQGRQ